MARVKSKNKTRFKFTYQFGLVMLFLTMILVLSIWFLIPSEQQRINNHFGGNLPQDHVVRRISQENFLHQSENLEDDQFMIVFFGTPQNVQILNQVNTIAGIFNAELERIHYMSAQFAVDLIDEKEYEDTETERQEEIETILDEHSDDLGFDVRYIPTIMLFTANGIISSQDETFDEDGEPRFDLAIFAIIDKIIQIQENGSI